MLARQDDDPDYDSQNFASGFFGSSPTAATTAPTLSGDLNTTRVSSPSTYEAPKTLEAPEDAAKAYSGGVADYSSFYGGTQQQAGTSLSTPPTGTQQQAGSQYSALLDSVKSATDPMQQAQARDSLARSLYSDFQAAGHDVKWDGDILVIDGRRYTVGGQTGTEGYDGSGIMAGQNLGAPAQAGASLAGDNVERTASQAGWDTNGYVAPQYTAQNFGSAPLGWDQQKWNDPNNQDPKYAVGRLLMEAGGDKARFAQLLAQAYPGAQFDGKDMVTGIPGLGPIDVYGGASIGQNTPQWYDVNAAAAEGGGAPHGPVTGGIDLAAQSQGAQGVTLGTSDPGFWVTLPNGQRVPYNHPLATQGGAPGAGGAPGTTGSSTPGFMTAPQYHPGDIPMNDIPDYTMEGLLGRMGNYDAERYNVGDMNVGPLEGDVEGLLSQILGRPESMDERTVSQLQARNREEQADLLRQADEDLVGKGYDYGIDGSPWLASERASARRGRDEAVMRGNRDVEIEAARTNAGDRRSAAQLGAAYVESKGARRRGEEGLRQSAATLNSQNAFNAARLRSDNVAQAAKTTLDAAAARGDRMALRESINQKATELGLSKDKLLTDYVVAQMNDATQRYGVDIEAQLRREGFDIDRAKLSQAGREFKEDLAFRLQALAQERELSLTNVGLGYSKLQNDADQANADRTARVMGF